MRKYVRLFTLALFTFLLSSMSVSAREMTIEELGEEASKIQSDAGYVYILGEYAFTSNYTIHQEDIIIASSSLNIENPTDLSQAVIYQIVRQRDDNYQPTGWQAGTNVLGNKKLPEKVNVKWIDMHRVLEKSEATINLDINNNSFQEYTKILNEKLHFDFTKAYGDGKLTYKDGKVTGILLKNTEITLSKDDQVKFGNPIYFFAYVLEVPNATSATKITTSGLGRDGELKWEKFDVTENTEEKKPGIVVLVPVDPEKWEEDPYLTITVDLDGDKEEQDEYGKTEYKLDLTELKFQQESKMDFTTENLPDADVKSILDKYGYSRSTSDTYQLESGDSANKYQLTGVIVEQKIKESAFPDDERTDFYFLLSVGQKIDPSLYRKATVTFPGDKSTKTSTITDETGVTILFSISNTNKNKPMKITVDLDGDGNEYYPVDYEIDLSGLTLEKSSKFSVLDVSNGGLVKNPLEDAYGWKQPDHYNVSFETNGTTVKVKGLLPILDSFTGEKHPFGKDEETGYYLPFVIKTLDKTTNGNGAVTVQFIHEGEDSKTLTADNFDSNDVLYILRHLDKDATDKTFKIVVDMDGDGTDYAPYEITFDWNELKLQERTVPNVKLDNASETDEKQLTGWGYDSSYNENLALNPVDGSNNSVQLTGTMKEQVVKSEAFGKGNENGYYFDFTFEIPAGVDKNQVKISRLNGSELSSDAKKDFDKSEWTEDGKLTILFRFPEDPECDSDGENCKLYYKVDYDGEGNEYLPTLYTIDYSEVTFKKSSLVTLEPVSKENVTGEGWKGFTEDDNYKVQFDEESSTFKVTGLITIFNDESWSEGDNPFGDAYDHYLAFKLSKAEVDGSDPSTIVKFLTEGDGHGETNTIGKNDFNDNKSIYVLKYLNPKKDYDNKKFTITIDFDDGGEEYAPYTITIDWSELDFQYESGIASTVVVDPTATDNRISRGYISEKNKHDIEGYGYDFDNIGNIQIEDEGNSGYKLTGTVKEQNVESAGFKEPAGYYVPIKIYGPTIPDAYGDHFLSQADGRKKWTIYLKNEDGTYRNEITPSADDYENGYIVVLFKLKANENNKITYKIDWDGSASNVFLAKEITISYEGLDYQALNKITYNYKDAEGKDQSVLTEVYQGEEATLKNITEINSDYRTFEGWYKSDKSKVVGETLTIDEDKDEILTAHWILDADAFIEAVMEDLNENYGKTEDSEKFNLTMDDATNTITIDVQDSRVLLSEMNETNIPGAIAYILQKGEVTGITLSTGDKEVEFTKDGANNEVVSKVSLDPEGSALKDKIKQGAQALFQEVLSDDEATYTLSKMALNSKEFTLEISSNDETVTFVDDSKKDYTFKFDSESYTVNDEGELKTALANEKITHIYLGSDFDVQEQHEIKRPVVINGEKYHVDGHYKISVSNAKKEEVESIFKVSSTGVTIDSIELSNVKTAIIVDGEGAELTTTGLTLTEIEEAGIEAVKGKVNANEVSFSGETHDIPTAKVKEDNKRNARVDIQNATENNPQFINVVLNHNPETLKDDTYVWTKDTYYYLTKEHIKNYVLVGFMGSFEKMWVRRLYEQGQTIEDFSKYFGTESAVVGEKTLYFVGYGSVNRGSSLKEGAYYKDLILNLTEKQAVSGEWYYANFAERDENKNVSLDESVEELEGYSSETKYYTYKFKDKPDGLTIGDLKAIDAEFAKMWQKLMETAQSKGKVIKYTKDDDEVVVEDSTIIDAELKLKFGDPIIQPLP